MTTYDPWKKTPWWLRWLGSERRKRFASPMIGGGFDGWEYRP
jgi:hypothetical protein